MIYVAIIAACVLALWGFWRYSRRPLRMTVENFHIVLSGSAAGVRVLDMPVCQFVEVWVNPNGSITYSGVNFTYDFVSPQVAWHSRRIRVSGCPHCAITTWRGGPGISPYSRNAYADAVRYGFLPSLIIRCTDERYEAQKSRSRSVLAGRAARGSCQLHRRPT